MIGDMMFARTHFLDRPLRCLFDFESSINEDELKITSTENSLVWDIILIIGSNRMLLNRTIPIVNDMMVKRSIEGSILGWGGDNCFIGKKEYIEGVKQILLLY
jgi:hypothetical protein